ncbi:MAG: YbaB/EbfC family nucleoid-associated protein [Synergistaceae bacterium]|nr:YbaB/EbfC family nucleoid-associated protein [Synergistaceae bacterium]
MNMNDLMKQAQKMQSQVAKIQEDLASETVEGNAGGGMVRAVFNGQGEIVSVHIEKEVVSADDVEMLEDLVTAAVGDGLRKAKELASDRMGPIAGGLGGMF